MPEMGKDVGPMKEKRVMRIVLAAAAVLLLAAGCAGRSGTERTGGTAGKAAEETTAGAAVGETAAGEAAIGAAAGETDAGAAVSGAAAGEAAAGAAAGEAVAGEPAAGQNADKADAGAAKEARGGLSAIEAFAEKIQEAVADKDMEALAELLSYPCRLTVSDEEDFEIPDREYFIKLNPDLVFGDDFMVAVATQDTAELYANRGEVFLGEEGTGVVFTVLEGAVGGIIGIFQ